MEFLIAIVVISGFFVALSVRIVPQQTAYIVERFGKFEAVWTAGIHTLIPFVDRVVDHHDLREIPMDVPSQICITRDNTQLQVDGILYFQVTDPKMASYGSSNYKIAITQLAQTTLRSVIGRMELDKTFEERDLINKDVVAALDDAALNWGVKVLRYEIKDLTPPNEILQAMQRQITAEREKRAVIATSEGKQQEDINLATGERQSNIQRSEGEMQAMINRSEGDRKAKINQAEGESEAIRLVAQARADAIGLLSKSIAAQGGLEAMNFRLAEQYIQTFSELAKENNTMIIPSNLADISGMVSGLTKVIQEVKRG
ncbi:MAG: SPFH/Band 7/PHB domain protein [Negativicutes bacterium]|jgi:regulator of protease activity HflC (stomatin/prohibitin superfamily)|nr:SPFH/Band 7/PHB domain protein [Negativicutes bacterium]